MYGNKYRYRTCSHLACPHASAPSTSYFMQNTVDEVPCYRSDTSGRYGPIQFPLPPPHSQGRHGVKSAVEVPTVLYRWLCTGLLPRYSLVVTGSASFLQTCGFDTSTSWHTVGRPSHAELTLRCTTLMIKNATNIQFTIHPYG